jgi:hypothetical protein
MKVAASRLDADLRVSAMDGDTLENQDERTPDVLAIAADFVGTFSWAAGQLLDFDHITLAPAGVYAAKVVATLVNPGVRSFGDVPCMLPEEGEWNTYQVSGKTRLRVRPTTGRARVYSAAIVDGELEISRRGQKTILRRIAFSGEMPAPSPAVELEEDAPLSLTTGVDSFALRSA